MNLYNDNENIKNNNEENINNFSDQNTSSYNYSWNTREPIYTEPPRKKGGAKRLFGGVMAVILSMCVISLATYGGYNIYQELTLKDSAPLNGEAPKVQITDIADYSKIHEKEIVEGEPLTAVQAIKKAKTSVVGIVSTVNRNGFLGKSTGSGIIMTSDGYIITNQHVVADASNVMVVFEDGKESPATIIGQDKKSDLAVLKIEDKNLPAAEFGNSDNLEVGESVIAIGNPLGLELFGTSTGGMISAINRDITIEDRVLTLIQTDASVNEGNSGGALINLYGQVIGINSAKISGTGVSGLSFAIPINGAKEVIDNLIQYGYVKDRPLIGITGQDIDESTARQYDIPQGVLVKTVSPGSSAEQSGIRSGDIIVKVNKRIIKNMNELNQEKDKHKAGEVLSLGIYRDGATFTANVTLMEEKPQTNG